MSAMPSKGDQLSRRGFLSLVVKGSLAGSALLGLGMLVRYLGFNSGGSAPRRFDLGPASGYPPGTRTPVQEAQALIVHGNQGYTAISLVCPHLGCTVAVTADGFACPCHGSHFLPDGSLRNGPASRPLDHLRVELDQEGHLILYNE